MIGKFILLAGLAIAAGSAQAATLTAFSKQVDGIVEIDTGTGNVTVIGGDYTGFLTNSIAGLAYDANGVLWGIAGSSYANVSIGTVNPLTGDYTLIGTDSVGGLSGASFAPDGTLYSRDGGSPTDFVAAISQTDATPTRVGDLGVGAAVGLAVSEDGKYAYSIDTRTNDLLRYDFALNSVSNMGMTTAGITALAFVGSTLFATTDTANDALISIDTLTGAELSRVALSTGAFTNITALAAAPGLALPPVPVPAGGLLLLSGLGGLCAWRRKLAAG